MLWKSNPDELTSVGVADAQGTGTTTGTAL